MKESKLFFGVVLIVFTSVSCTQTLACTIFSASIDDTVLFGNNEDYFLEGTFIWFVPALGSNHGYTYFSYEENNDPADGNPQGGMNDQGLAFDANALPPVQLNEHPERPSFPSDFRWGWDYFLERFNLVSEVEDFFNTYGRSISYSFSGQLNLADATGDAAIMSGGADGEWTFTRKINASYLISTNFNRATSNGSDLPWSRSWRYKTADSMLSQINSEENLTIEAFHDILNAVHQEGNYPTLYSNVYDLNTGDIWLYYFYNFEEVVKLNLDEELAKITLPTRFRISEMFPHTISIPTIRIPRQDSILTGTIPISWGASFDSRGHDLSYSLEYSSNGGSSWDSITTNLRSTLYAWNTTLLPNGSNYKVKVIANCSDGWIAEDITNGTFTIMSNVPSTSTIQNSTTTSTTATLTGGSIPGFTVFVLLAPLAILTIRRMYKKALGYYYSRGVGLS